MDLRDNRGLTLSGATSTALERFEQALAAFLLFRADAAAHLQGARHEAPGFVMAHVFAAYMALSGRNPAGAAAAQQTLGHVRSLPMNARERAHVLAAELLAAGELERASAVHDAIIAEAPRDVLALHVAQATDYLMGDARSMQRRAADALPAWDASLPGYHAALSMHAFGLEETGQYDLAEAWSRRALEIEPADVRAYHTVMHVHEMRGDADAGIRWAGENAAFWAAETPVALHCWWHVALFHQRRGQPAQALAVFDWRLRRGLGRALSVLIDATALLWRLELAGVDVGDRWRELAELWSPHAEDAYCAFSDMHAMMAFAAGGLAEREGALLAAQERRIGLAGTNGAMTRLVGLPACRAIRAFGRGRYTEAVRLLSALPPLVHRIGGSRAQQSIIALTLEAAARRADRSAPTFSFA